MEVPNWLVCATCGHPIVADSELIHAELAVLKKAVYAYRLDILSFEVPVYSATNSADNRFDVVRALLSESTILPILRFDSQQANSVSDRDSLRDLIRHLQGVHDVRAGDRGQDDRVHLVDDESNRRILADLERFVDEEGFEQESEQDETSLVSPLPDVFIQVVPPRASVTGGNTVSNRLTTIGEPTDDYSWFPGFAWTIASCASCGYHLGWLFYSQSENEWKMEFASLIVTKLREKRISFPVEPSA